MAWIYEVGVKKYFTQAQMENNAVEFYGYFSAKGATVESISGMLGNIHVESTINPGIKQSESTSSGWGLIQWTKATVLTDWCRKYNYVWYDGAAQCERIWCEGTRTKGAGGYWLPTSSYPYKWSEYIALTDVTEATKAYLYERERPKDPDVDLRVQRAGEWYEFLTGNPPIPPTPYKTTSKLPVYMMLRKYY